jgi:prolyl-tRNA synthetase
MPAPVLIPQATDFPGWYQDVVAKAELAETGPVRGTMVIRPWGYAIWEHLQREIDNRIKAAGAENVYFPLLIPEGHLKREAEHVEGFSPELAVVTHAGGRELQEPAIIRPTSETVFGEYLAKWIQSYRDLPLRLNQWANVVRWELRPRLFLRTSEFLWQEGHTAHTTQHDAAAYARQIHEDVYRSVLADVLAIPVLTGLKTDAERFAGATSTLTCEGMMRDGKALQLATSHELGQNFSRAFDITYTDEDDSSQLCWTTSWGSSTRMIGGLVMTHGDDAGLRLPPKVAPVQVVIVLIKADPDTTAAAEQLEHDVHQAGLRVRVDMRTDLGLGRRLTDWELKGVPVRIEVGPRDLKEGTVTLVRRDGAPREKLRPQDAARAAQTAVESVHEGLFAQATGALRSRTIEVEDVDAAREAARTGFARLPWAACGPDGERELNRAGLSVRCLATADGSIPESNAGKTASADELYAIIARAY